MRRAGKVVGAAGGVAVLRTPDSDHRDGAGEPDVPPIGTTIVDETLTQVGRVVDVFGPVDRPYLAVTPADGVDPAAILGDRLYARD